jgi:hypothetical protein
MKPTSSDTAQTSFLLPDLEKQLDPRRLLYRLAQAIDWKSALGNAVRSERDDAFPQTHRQRGSRADLGIHD